MRDDESRNPEMPETSGEQDQHVPDNAGREAAPDENTTRESMASPEAPEPAQDEIDRDLTTEKSSIVDLLYGVITAPIKTLRHISDNKLVWPGIAVYVITSWLVTIASLSGTATQFEQLTGTYEQVPGFDTAAFRSITLVFALIGTPIFAVLGLLFIAGVFYLMAKLLKGKGDYWGLLSALGFARFPSILTIPLALFGLLGSPVWSIVQFILTLPISLWVLGLEVIAIRENNKFSTGRALATYFIPIITFIVFIVLLIIGIALLILGVVSEQ